MRTVQCSFARSCNALTESLNPWTSALPMPATAPKAFPLPPALVGKLQALAQLSGVALAL